MSTRAPRISRRKLLQISSVAPLSALLMAGTATDEQIVALATSLQGSTEKELWEKASKVPGAHEQNFKMAVRILVQYFVAGALDKNLVIPADKQRHLFVVVAYEQRSGTSRSGDLIAARSAGWQRQMYQTTACAYLCGAEFAIAGADFGDESTVAPAYATAFSIVRDSMSILFARVRKIGDDRPDAPGGAGC